MNSETHSPTSVGMVARHDEKDFSASCLVCEPISWEVAAPTLCGRAGRICGGGCGPETVVLPFLLFPWLRTELAATPIRQPSGCRQQSKRPSPVATERALAFLRGKGDVTSKVLADLRRDSSTVREKFHPYPGRDVHCGLNASFLCGG